MVAVSLTDLDVSLDASYVVGSEAYIFAVVVRAPNGEVIQVGGYNRHVAVDRYLHRMAPVHFTQLAAPADGGGAFAYSRDVSGLALQQLGAYQVYAELLHATWATTTFHGSVSLRFDVLSAAPTRRPPRAPSTGRPTVEGEAETLLGEAEAQGGSVLLGVLLFCGALVTTFMVALYVTRRDREGPGDSRAEGGGGGGDSGGGDVVLSPLQASSTAVPEEGSANSAKKSTSSSGGGNSSSSCSSSSRPAGREDNSSSSPSFSFFAGSLFPGSSAGFARARAWDALARAGAAVSAAVAGPGRYAKASVLDESGGASSGVEV